MEKLYSLSYLHDLARPDLQALCKKHGLKAMGKNSALVTTLSRLHAPGNEALKKEIAKRKGAAPSNAFSDDKLKQAAGLPVRRSTRRVPSRSGSGPVQTTDAGEVEEHPVRSSPKKTKAPQATAVVAAPVKDEVFEPALQAAVAGPLRRGRSSNRVDPISTAARPSAKRKSTTSPTSPKAGRHSSVSSDAETVVGSSSVPPKSPSPPPSPPTAALDEATIHSMIESAVRSSEARLLAQQEELNRFNERVNKLESTMKTLHTAQDAAKETLSQLSQAVKDVQQPPPRPVLLRTLPEVEYPSSLAFHARIELRLEQELWQKEKQKAAADQQEQRPPSPQHDVVIKKPVTSLNTSPTTTPPGSPPMGPCSPTRRFQDNVLENADLPPQNVVWDEEAEEFHNLLLMAMSERQEVTIRSDTPEPEEELKRRPQRGHVRSSGVELLKAALNHSRGVRRLKRQLWLHENRGRLAAANAGSQQFKLNVPQHLLPDDDEQADPPDDSELLRWKSADPSATAPMAIDGDDYEDEDEDEEDEDADADADVEMDDTCVQPGVEQMSFDSQSGANSAFMQQQGAFTWDSTAPGTELQMSNPTYAGDMGFSVSTFATEQMPVSADSSNSLHGVMEHFGGQIYSPSQSDGTLTMQAGGVQAQSGIIDMTAQGGGLCQQVVGYHQLVLNDGTQLHQQYAINTSLIPPSSPQSQSPSQSDLDALFAGSWNSFGQQDHFAIDPRLMSLPSPSPAPSFDSSASLLGSGSSSPTMSFDTGLTSPSGSSSGSNTMQVDTMQVDPATDMSLLGVDPIPIWDDSAMYMDMSSFNMFSGSIWTPEKPQGSARVYDGPSVAAWRAWAAPHLRAARSQLRTHPELPAAVTVADPPDLGFGVPGTPEPRYRARERTFHDKIEDLVSVAVGGLPEHGRGSQPGPPVWIDEPPPDPKHGHPGEYVWVSHEGEEDGPK